ncbi:MAG: F0F1 ATP synthase subunit A [Chitinophagaceae bacterium]
MVLKCSKLLLALSFSIFTFFFSTNLFAQKKSIGEILKPGEILMEHVMDAHEFHFITIGEYDVSIPLPVIIYSPQRGFTAFMSSKFNHGHNAYEGYRIIDEAYFKKLQAQGVDTKKQNLSAGKLIAVDANDNPDSSIKIYDLSITRNVAQMIIAVILLVWLLTSIGKKYKENGAKAAPTGFQNAMEPVITFLRDDIGKSILGKKYEKYMPYLLTVFFFILINTLVGLIPGTANVTGNIAFTGVLGVISFIVIMASSKKQYWMHIFNPPGVPGWVKIILIPVEILGIFTKPFALIIRLFANMIAGHMIITCLVLLIFIFGILNTAAGYGFSPISLAFCVFIYFIELLVAFLQAYIFTNLTAVFISQAFESHHDEGAHL